MIQPSSQSKGRTITGIPAPADLLDAHSMLAHHYPRTPLYFSAALSRQSGCEVFVKYENHGPVRSFKARGALYRLSLLSADERRRGVVAASTGNHGQGIAYAARVLGISATVVVPDGTPELKTDAIESHDCELRIIGGDLAESNEEAQTIAAREGKLFVEDGNDGGLMAGAASIAWEVLEELPGRFGVRRPRRRRQPDRSDRTRHEVHQPRGSGHRSAVRGRPRSTRLMETRDGCRGTVLNVRGRSCDELSR